MRRATRTRRRCDDRATNISREPETKGHSGWVPGPPSDLSGFRPDQVSGGASVENSTSAKTRQPRSSNSSRQRAETPPRNHTSRLAASVPLPTSAYRPSAASPIPSVQKMSSMGIRVTSRPSAVTPAGNLVPPTSRSIGVWLRWNSAIIVTACTKNRASSRDSAAAASSTATMRSSTPSRSLSYATR